jgi:hypothetical protein
VKGIESRRKLDASKAFEVHRWFARKEKRPGDRGTLGNISGDSSFFKVSIPYFGLNV